MIDAVLAEKLGAISDRLARMEERQIAASTRESDVLARIVALEARISSIEHARWWLAGAAAAIAGLTGWFAKTVHVTTGGH